MTFAGDVSDGSCFNGQNSEIEDEDELEPA